MQVVADTHVHLYDGYDMGAALQQLSQRLASFANDTCHLAACLTERNECNVFETLRDGTLSLAGLDMSVGDDPAAMQLRGQHTLNLYSGFQIITKERLEVLALVCATRIPDGQDLDVTIEAVRAAGGIPVLPWSPGKWCGTRGDAIKRVLTNAKSGHLCIGDTAMRPAGLPKPCLFKRAHKNNISCLAGTDPLPFAGDETIMGTYISAWDSRSGQDVITTDHFRDLLVNHTPQTRGNRNNVVQSVRRWISNARSKS
ncbi:MAG: hypothetical protein OSB41_12115 [Kiritimatiellae bacterium]|nr:hypothetical protein [Kiritimatiellia bacterium]